MSRKIPFALVWAAILMGFASLPSPADTILDDFQVNAEFPGHPPQDSPMSVANWQTQRIYTTFLSKHDGTNWDVALARHNYNLQPVGQTTYLNVREGTYNCQRPKLVIRSGGEGAAWIEARSPNRIMYRSLNGEGVPTCPPVRIEDNFDNVLRDSLSIAALSDGFLLVWYDTRDSSKIWAQKVNLLGQLIGPNFPIQPDSTGSILGLEAQNHPDGRVLVSWVTNGQYSRGWWLDTEGNFMGAVFEMAEGWFDNMIANSLVRFELGGTGILYQYASIGEWGGGPVPYKYIYITYLDAMGLQTAERFQSGWWSYEEDYVGSMTSSFPDLIFLPDSNYVRILKRQFYADGSDPDWTKNLLYSTAADTEIIPWGTATGQDLCQLTNTTILYTFDLAYIGMREYEINGLDSSAQIIWTGEPGFNASQYKSDICTHLNGGFRIIYDNELGSSPQLYTRHFSPDGTPSAEDTVVSLNINMAPVMTSGGRILKTASDQALVIWPYGSDILGITFEGNAWTGIIDTFGCNVAVDWPYIPRFDINASNHVMLLWNVRWWSQVWEVYEHQLFAQSFQQIFGNLGTSFAASPVTDASSYILGYDLALRDDGRFLICRSGLFPGDEGLSLLPGINYQQLVGQPQNIEPFHNGIPTLGVSDDGYWLTWVEDDSVLLLCIDVNGNPIGQAWKICAQGAVAMGRADISVSPSDNFAVVWQDARNDAGDIYCRQFNPDGSFFGNEYRVNSDPAGVMQKEPAVAFGPDDRLYFTWTDFRNPGGQGDIYCKVIEWEDALDAPDDPPPLPKTFALYPPSPNPFNSTTVIRFELPQAALVKLQIFDISGREVGASSASGATPTRQWYNAGAHEVRFDGTGLASGIYIARLQAGEFVGVEKMVLLK